MKSIFILFQWELRRILSNWRQTLAIFLVPAVVIVAALYLFPATVDYLSTGSIGDSPVILVQPDDNFLAYIEVSNLAANSQHTIISCEEFETALHDGSAIRQSEKGGFFVVFSTLPTNGSELPSLSFDEATKDFYIRLVHGNSLTESSAVITIYANPDNTKSLSKSMQYEADVLEPYESYLLQTTGNDYFMAGGGDAFSVNSFNPYTSLMNHRSIANNAAGKVIPGMMILLLYYCVYSLSGDILAADRQRGFLSKLTLTPISTGALLGGKAMAVVSIGFLTSVFTLLILILSSWVNRSNSPLSLLPFGLFLFPSQLAMVFTSILVAGVLMTAYCFKVIMDLHKMQDIILNLQMPLLLFLVDFFLQLFRSSSPVFGEYMIPLHNNLIIIRDILDNSLQIGNFWFVMAYDSILACILFLSVRKSFSAAPIDVEVPRRQK